MAITFKKATREKLKLRLALTGPAGAGKTFTALRVATALGGRIAVIDSERGSARKYASLFDFDVLELESFHPDNYTQAIKAAVRDGYAVVIIDSLSHAWMGKDGALEQVDKLKNSRQNGGSSFNAWRDVTPMQNDLMDAIMSAACHVIATMRSKAEFVIEENERGKKAPRKVGTAPQQREGVDFEFDIVGDLDVSNTMIVSKTRCPALKGAHMRTPGEDFAEIIKTWLNEGEAPAPQAPRLVPVPASDPAPVPDLTHGLAASGEVVPEIIALGARLDRLVGKETAARMREANGVVNVRQMTHAQKLVARDALRVLVEGAEADAAMAAREPVADEAGDTAWSPAAEVES